MAQSDEMVQAESVGPELLAEILKQKRALIDAGARPERVVLSMTNYRAIQLFHATLGEAPEIMPDYITRYTIFELPVFIDNDHHCTVQ